MVVSAIKSRKCVPVFGLVAQINPLIPPQPPPQTPVGPAQPNAILIVIVVVGFLMLVGIRPRRESILHKLRYLIIAGIVGYLAYLIAGSDPKYQAASSVIAILVVVMIYAMRPARRRRIPKSIRRRTITDWEHKTGKRFNARTHELDHIVPFSKGGSHTSDNLRVLEKERNRSKGAKNPWWDIFGLWQ
jgi:hypothetical protein